MAEIIRIAIGTVNCYLIRENGAAILVDAANEGSHGAIEKALLAHGTPPKSLAMVFLTHGHPDHAGSAAYFHDYYNVPVALNSVDVHMRELKSRGAIGAALHAVTMPMIRRHTAPWPAHIRLEELESLNGYGIDAKVLPLAGHTQGSMGLLFPDGRLVAGDMYMNFVRPGLAYLAEDYTVMRKTNDMLKGLPLTTIYHGHGKPFDAGRIAAF